MIKNFTTTDHIVQSFAQSSSEQLKRLVNPFVGDDVFREFDSRDPLAELGRVYDHYALTASKQAFLEEDRASQWVKTVFAKIQASDVAMEQIKAYLDQPGAWGIDDHHTALLRDERIGHESPVLREDTVDFDYLNIPVSPSSGSVVEQAAADAATHPLNQVVASAVQETLAEEGIKLQQMPDWAKTAIVNIFIALITSIIGPLLVQHFGSHTAAATSTQVVQAAAATTANLCIVTSSGTYLTSGPNTRQRHIALTHEGDLVRVIKRQKGWAYVELHTQDPAIARRGWIKAKHLQSLATIANRIVSTTLMADDGDAD